VVKFTAITERTFARITPLSAKYFRYRHRLRGTCNWSKVCEGGIRKQSGDVNSCVTSDQVEEIGSTVTESTGPVFSCGDNRLKSGDVRDVVLKFEPYRVRVDPSDKF
jgi:hypothetical protein